MTDEVDESTGEAAADAAGEPDETDRGTGDDNDDGAGEDAEAEEPHRRTRFAEIADRLEQPPTDASPNTATDAAAQPTDGDEDDATAEAAPDDDDFGSWEWFGGDDTGPDESVVEPTQAADSETDPVDVEPEIDPANSSAMSPDDVVDEQVVTVDESDSTDPTSTDPTSTDPTSTDPTSTDPTSTDPASTDPASTDPTSTDSEEHGSQAEEDLTNDDNDDSRKDGDDDSRRHDRVWSPTAHTPQADPSPPSTPETVPTASDIPESESTEPNVAESLPAESGVADTEATESTDADLTADTETPDPDTPPSTGTTATDDETDRGSDRDTADDEETAASDSMPSSSAHSPTSDGSDDPKPSHRGKERRLWNRDETPAETSPGNSEFLRGGARSEPSGSSNATPAASSQSGTDTATASGDDPGTDTESGSAPTTDRSPTRTWRPTNESDAPGPMETFDDPEAYARPAGFDPQPGISTLIQCGSQDDRKHAACADLLGLDTQAAGRNVLLVSYRQIHEGRLERIASEATRTTLIAIGYAQPVPDSIADDVETVQINNPNDITRLGILVSGTVDDWADDTDQETVLCYDSLNVLMEYKDIRSTFRFLHIFLGTLQGADVIAHFHVDPLAGDPQDTNTLKPLFDDVVSIDAAGAHLE